MTQLRLQLEGFEGPLELLLSLIEARRLPITQVSLAQVADQYLAYVHALPELDPDLLSDFLSIGGRLLLLKSRALLLTDEPDAVVEETASELEERLATYQLFRAAALQLQELEARGERTYLSTRPPLESFAPPPLAPTSPSALAAAMKRLLQAKPAEPARLELAPRASVDERRAFILDELKRVPALSFLTIAGTTVDEVVACFLAILELFRRHLVGLRQAEQFGDVAITRPDQAASIP